MKLYGLIGKELQHSFSPNYFKEKFRRENINAKYELFPMDSVNDLRNWVKSIPNLSGFNVTIPYKEKILPYLDEVDEVAFIIGAVNTVTVEHLSDNDILLKGYNTDWIGFKESLIPLINNMPQPIRKALVLGTGGASKAIVYVLKQLGISYSYVSRNPQNPDVLGYSDLTDQVIFEHLLIINTTPVGMYPLVDESHAELTKYISKKHLVFDLVYNPPLTKLLKESKSSGALVKNGLEMLEIQAEQAYQLFMMK